jgi:HK97 family phage portal protein
MPYTEEKLFSEGDSYGLTYRWVMKMAGEQNLSRPYAQHPWVHACVAAIGKAVSSVPLVLQRERSDGSVDPVEEGALYDLLARPNKLMSQRKFLTSLTQTQKLYGETMILMMEQKPNGVISYIDPADTFDVPAELWPVRGDLLDEIIDENTQLPRAWRMTTQKGTMEIPDDSLIHVAESNPYNPIRGMGPMQAAYRTAAKDFVLDRYDEALLQNSGSPGGILSVDGHLTDADQRAISDAWREAHGRPDSHRKTAVLPQGTKYEEIGFSPQEMEFMDMRAWNRETIMAIFGVTKPIIGLTEGLNYASSMSAFRTFWEVTVIPFLDFLSDEIETKFIQRLRGPESEYRIGFDLSGVAALREDADSKVERTIKLFAQGGRTFNEAADLAGWDIGDTELVNADEAYMSTSMVAVGEEAPEEEVPAATLPSEQILDEEDEGEEDVISAEEELAADEEERSFNPVIHKLDQAELDDVYRRWQRLVNMSASELRTWAKSPCSKKASLNPANVIRRNLRLLETKKADWDGSHVKAAKRAISFISRMRGAQQGPPAAEGCPSKRDISLRNWAFNPQKSRNGQPVKPRKDYSNPEERQKRWNEWNAAIQKSQAGVARSAKRVLRDLVLHMRKRLREVAMDPDYTRGKRSSVVKTIATETEIARLLDLNVAEWGDEMAAALSPKITDLIVQSAVATHNEIGGAGLILSTTDPVVVRFMAEKQLILANISKNTIDEVQRAIVRILAKDDTKYGSLREAIYATLAESEEYLGRTLKGVGTRAQLIARTETTGAANFGRFQQFAEDGIYSGIWHSPNPANARPHHQELNGRERNLGDEFGYGLRYPGDPNADVSELANCNCLLLPGKERES